MWLLKRCITMLMSQIVYLITLPDLLTVLDLASFKNCQYESIVVVFSSAAKSHAKYQCNEANPDG